MIEVAALRKVYPGDPPVVAVDEVSFTARPGQIFGLLGPNGAGKTTTLRIVSTILRPSGGSVRVDGVSVTEDPRAVRRRIGFLSAGTALYERLSPREHLDYFGRLCGLDSAAIRERTDALADALAMESFLDRPCGLLSTGQKQKTSIARALVHDPPVLVFDEPTAGLDVLVARALVERIEGLRDARRTIVLSTHIMSEAERLCDVVAVIHRGRILAEGSVANLLDRAGAPNLEEAFFALVRAAEESEPTASEGGVSAGAGQVDR
ncbi:MAG: ATP-binding cassette domain-containing protein [Planctomycetota bacterium]|nr:MAG: ATP-binding cassette domain-containing protein [Planctomycetota bacterium]